MLARPISRKFSSFRLSPSFTAKYGALPQPAFGFNGVGQVAFLRSYSRPNPNRGGLREKWFETVTRVVEGAFQMQIDYFKESNLKYDAGVLQEEAMEMYDRIYHCKFLPPGRGLWAMGTSLISERKQYAALNNCAFVSTKVGMQPGMKPGEEFVEAVAFLMDAAMLGVGVGFDTLGSGEVAVKPRLGEKQVFVVPDSRQGWVEATKMLLRAYLVEQHGDVEFDYSEIRPAGLPLKAFGGTSSGPKPLIDLHTTIRNLLTSRMSLHLSTQDIVDVMNIVGKCVIAGNIRRVAEIALAPSSDPSFLRLKDYELHPERAAFGWVSNNSVFAQVGQSYQEVADQILRTGGEPGLCWLENMREYGRMGQPDDMWNLRGADSCAMGGNPCLEQTLESHELCCLVETFPNQHESYAEFQKTLRAAFLYAKSVTLGLPQWPASKEVMARNRRIGCSLSGIAQFVGRRGMGQFVHWCDNGYDFLKKFDAELSQRWSVPKSIKITSIKPSGTVSLLAGATPGIHFPIANHYIRRIRIEHHSSLIKSLSEAGYPIEPDQVDPSTLVVEFPVSVGPLRTLANVGLWEQMQLAATLQRVWADNQVSCTVSFDEEKEGDQISHALDLYQYHLKGISFLPKVESGYAQMPYESISEEEYERRKGKLRELKIDEELLAGETIVEDKFCSNDTCTL